MPDRQLEVFNKVMHRRIGSDYAPANEKFNLYTNTQKEKQGNAIEKYMIAYGFFIGDQRQFIVYGIVNGI